MSADVRGLLETRLAEIDDEAGRLRRALDHLGAVDSGPRRPGRRKGTRRGGRKRAKRGERQRQLLDAIEKMPGASALELADAIGVGSAQAHALLRALQAKKLIKQKGQGFAVAK